MIEQVHFLHILQQIIQHIFGCNSYSHSSLVFQALRNHFGINMLLNPKSYEGLFWFHLKDIRLIYYRPYLHTDKFYWTKQHYAEVDARLQPNAKDILRKALFKQYFYWDWL